MPRIRIQTSAELKRPIVRNRRGDIINLEDLRPIQPNLKVPRVSRLPIHLQDNLMPLARAHGAQVGKGPRGLVADCPRLHARVQLVPLQPDHGGRHPVLAAAIGEVGDELREVVGLGGELPVLLQAEGEAVEACVAAFVDVVLHDFGVVSAAVAAVIGLDGFDGGGTLVDDVGDLFDLAVVFLVDGVPARGGAGVAEDLAGGGSKAECHQGSRGEEFRMHVGSRRGISEAAGMNKD
ncbi:uncharacterized protein DSM5745_01744 [Aspergillus mulundensis]|uniref:Uncharacterized protein n=1 Tax=Aspergillus mulundensis TaxID=1810919 RepID=A0A3D8SUM2_9EURO|nr:hypothetical protein DSM5745_01744 [Aspergillus mulundensis]RDW89969.1 hypothetical protein DSM5745_01744 [Aspergillus mulundensis]